MDRSKINDQPITIAQWLDKSTIRLKKAGVDSARLDCLILLENTLTKERGWLLAHDDEPLGRDQLDQLDTFVTQRESRIPLAYIIGSKEFYGHTFLVDENVLIPRPESEALVEMAIRRASKNTSNTIIDVGTGSGCLAITLKHQLPDVHVTGIDNSEAALNIARRNARQHAVQIQWKRMDIYEQGLPPMAQTRPYVVVANLPYVPENLITSPEITKEPAAALFSGEDGLHHYQRLWRCVVGSAHKPRAVITESLETQHEALRRLAKTAGYELSETSGLAQLFEPSKDD